MNPCDLSEGDSISIDTGGLSDITFHVSDVDVTDIGLAETVAVTLLCGCERYAITGVTVDRTYTLEHLDGDESWTVFQQDIVVE